MRSKGGSNSRNRLREAPLTQLLQYNGTDSLLEWEVCMRQMKDMGVKL